MDRFETEPQHFYRHQAKLLTGEPLPRSIDEMNVSELEVFMLRGRRLQARAMGDAFTQLFGWLRQALRHLDIRPGARHPHSNAAG